MNLSLNDTVDKISGVGPETAIKFRSVGIKTIEDLFDYWPRRYEDYSKVLSISDSVPGPLTVYGSITNITARYVRRGLHITEALARDSSGAIKLVWFNQPYRSKSLKKGINYYISGNYDTYGGRLCVSNPSLLEDTPDKKLKLIIPVYPENKLLSSSVIRRAMSKVDHLLKAIPDSLPKSVVESCSLISRSDALRMLHFPEKKMDIDLSKERLAFEELFQMQLSTALVKRQIVSEKAKVLKFNLESIKRIIDRLPYKLTDDQRAVLWDIFKDMDSNTPMNRLVEGDVGSGKTVVAAIAAAVAFDSNYQTLFMAPTEILATQHLKTLRNIFEGTEYVDSILLLTGKMKNKDKDLIREKVLGGGRMIIVGTQALLQEKFITKNVGLVIVDEQHRFGVNQRQKLRQKAGYFPHFLSMTATPIPRSLALTLYGELDVSIISKLPPGRKETVTKIVPFESRHNLYKSLKELLDKDQQVYIVCPLINESEQLKVNAVEKVFEEISKKQLKGYPCGLLHGNMKSDEKDGVMLTFREGKIKVLVSTTVIEVGVDVPSANIMVIEGAERFGLAQIHQLRGRVGRAGDQGYCYLIPSQDIGETKRLRAVASTSDGFKLAEMDLELRGPGAIYGTRQSGVLDLRIARFDNMSMIQKARSAAEDFLESGESVLKYAVLSERVRHFQSLTSLN